MELTDLTLFEAAGMISRGEVSSVELTQACLERIHRLEPELNCFITLTGEQALAQASQADEAQRHPPPIGPLHGIPLALKDLYETAGVRTTAGSRFFQDYIPKESAWVVQKLVSAGAILIGKLNMHEIALGVTNDNPHFGACKNPWDFERIPGGSSGGSAAALVAGLCFGSLGSDTGGSIRIPASLCGAVGLKPTYGRVSLRGVIPLSWSLDHAGPMARCVRDAAVLLQVVAAYDAQDPASVEYPAGPYLDNLEAGVKGWRIALAVDDFFTHSDPEVWQAVQEAAAVFDTLGGEVRPVEFPGARQAAKANGLITTSEAAAFHRERLKDDPGGFGADVLQRLNSGAAFTSTEYVLARRDQKLLRRKFEQFFLDFDILLTPTTPIAAPLRQGTDAVERAKQLTRFTAPFNLTGLPALSLPCGFTREGLPIGLQIVSQPWGEARVLQAGYAYERATAWQLTKPDL